MNQDASSSLFTRRLTIPRAFLLYERYTSENAFRVHRQTPHFKNIIEKQVVPLLDERVWTRLAPLPA